MVTNNYPSASSPSFSPFFLLPPSLSPLPSHPFSFISSFLADATDHCAWPVTRSGQAAEYCITKKKGKRIFLNLLSKSLLSLWQIALYVCIVLSSYVLVAICLYIHVCCHSLRVISCVLYCWLLHSFSSSTCWGRRWVFSFRRWWLREWSPSECLYSSARSSTL